MILFSVLEFEHVYIQNMPCAEGYERSYMHRDVVSHVTVTWYAPLIYFIPLY